MTSPPSRWRCGRFAPWSRPRPCPGRPVRQSSTACPDEQRSDRPPGHAVVLGGGYYFVSAETALRLAPATVTSPFFGMTARYWISTDEVRRRTLPGGTRPTRSPVIGIFLAFLVAGAYASFCRSTYQTSAPPSLVLSA